MNYIFPKTDCFKKTTLLLAYCLLAIVPAYAQKIGVTNTATFTPNYLLHIHDNVATTGTLLQLTNSNSGSLTTDGFRINLSTGKIEFVNQENEAISFFTNNLERMYISSAGNVGIGITTPLNKLDILGGAARTGSHASSRSLYVTGTFGAGSSGVEFRHDNGTQGIGFGYNTIYATGSNAIQDLGLQALGATGNLNFTTNALQRMIILGSNGNVGIGTTSPSAKLHVNAGDGSLALFGPNTSWGGQLYVGASPNQGLALTAQVISTDGNLHLDPAPSKNMYLGYYQARDIYINPNGGNVGIGTTSPVAKLEMEGTSNNWNETTMGLTTGSIHLDPGSASDHYGSAITWGASDASNGDDAQAGIYVRSDGSYGTKMYFATTDAYVSGSKDRMMINYNGYVGIGTASPQTQLHTTGTVRFANYISGANGAILRTNSSGDLGVTNFSGTATDVLLGTNTFGPISNIAITGTCGTPNYIPKMSSSNVITCSQIYDNGTNVGIGTTSPGKKLEVNGDIKLSSAGYQIYLGENVTTSAKIGINFHTDADPNYWIGKPAGAWTQPLHIGFYTGIKIGANSGYGGTRFYNSSDMSTEIMSVGNGDNHVRIPNYLYIGSYGGISSIPTTYGSLGLLQAKNGYYGILMGQSTSNPNFMWDGAGNGGIYYENWGWLNYTTASNHYTGFGTTSPAYKLHVAGDVYANGGWFRVSGNQGLYWESWGPGWYVQDGTWLRTYNNASIWANTGTIATNGSFSGGYGGAGGPSGGAIFSSLVGIGTSSPSTSYAGGVSVDKMNIYSTTTPASSAMVEFTNASGNGVGLESYCSSTTNAFNANEGVTNNADLVYAPSGVWGLAINTSTYGIGTSGLTNALNTGSYGVYASCRYSNSAGYYGLYSSGRVFSTGGYYVPSDKKLKKNITPLDSALSKILKLLAVEYDFNEEYSDFISSTERQAGFIAQDVEEIFPGTDIVSPVVLTSFDKPYAQNSMNKVKQLEAKSISYQSLIPYMVEAMKEQQKMIEDLKTKVTELENEIKKLENK
ncbi:MAG: tail fiber domain-containing protein [Bacteroidota bacterium]